MSLALAESYILIHFTNWHRITAAAAPPAAGVPDAGCTNSTSAYCLAISGVTCRYSLRPSSSTCRDKAGDCDVAEQCSGTAADCPADVLLSNATVCRPAAGLVPEQNCTGTSAGCPGYGSSVNCSAQTVPECADPETGEAITMHAATSGRQLMFK